MLGALLVAGAACAPAAGQQDGGLLLAPAELDLGIQAPDAMVGDTVWLINTGDEAVEVLAAKGSCGCIEKFAIDEEVIEPGAAVAVPVRVESPRTSGKLKVLYVWFLMRGGDTLDLPVRLEGIGAGSRRPEIGISPRAVDLGEVAAVSPVEDILLLTNKSSRDLDIVKVTSGCGCITFPEFMPVVLAPGETEELILEVTPRLDDVGREADQRVHVFVKGQKPVSIPVRYRARHALVGVVRGYLDAMARSNDPRVHTALAEGVTPSLAAAGILRESRGYDSFRLEGPTVRVLAWAGDRRQRRPIGELTFRLDESSLIESIEGTPLMARHLGGHGS